MNKTIAITTSSFAKYDKTPLLNLTKAGIAYSLNPYGRKLTAEEVVELAKDVDGLIAGTESLNEIVLSKLHNLKVISRCGVGIDNIDLTEAEKIGVKVLNTPNAPTDAVAELTICMILDLLRHVTTMDRMIRHGTWKKHMGNLLRGKKVGIIGFGRIGQAVARLLLTFGSDIIYCDENIITTSLSATQVSMSELLSSADIITIHVSNTTQGRHIIARQELEQMKKGTWLINTSRGGMVDEKSLLQSLKNKHISGAALDVFESEPYDGSLTQLDNVLLTPHIGSYTIESRIDMEMQATFNLINELKNK
ncbi:MAG: phosphoglycerate dehydrogenase [Nitrospirae bacterium]|nr:phosphoglycerate dehydrogenase [Nitrospirota bacterium]